MEPVETSDPEQNWIFVDVERLTRPRVGHVIRLARIAKGLSQDQLAETAGLYQTDVSRAERQPGSMRLGVLRRLFDVLGLTVEEVTGDGYIDIDPDSFDRLTPKQVQRFREVGLLQGAS